MCIQLDKILVLINSKRFLKKNTLKNFKHSLLLIFHNNKVEKAKSWTIKQEKTKLQERKKKKVTKKKKMNTKKQTKRSLYIKLQEQQKKRKRIDANETSETKKMLKIKSWIQQNKIYIINHKTNWLHCLMILKQWSICLRMFEGVIAIFGVAVAIVGR
ncbi:phosphatidylinositol 4-kinase [Reticulomyxa filosa]|uniref:Phosphatidylinositol 4-kinase n=1 Tax=Reticulomyxa filosa TaxID=46433 RepID=X6LXZ8_RETFI|nr:phosphatidylinositol 4-kinase [Reticulomyxa filosa]|eukprot:ETO05605.1 phosphatidylinositol 4-kinase [Reticulomyxa filosa]